VSPEQAQGLSLDHRTDIFSLGCVLYEVITGQRAFHGASPMATLRQIIEEEPPPIATRAPSAPADLERIVRGCLAKNPEGRYQSMRDVASELRHVQRELETTAPAPRRRIGRRTAIVTMGAGALGAAAVWSRFSAGSSPPPVLTIERLTTSGTAIDAAISHDGRLLAWVTSAGGRQGLRVREIGGTREVELVPAAAVGFWGIAFSPSGRDVYYATKSAQEPAGRLFAVAVEGGAWRPLVDAIDSTVTFSPDGQRIAFYRAGADFGARVLRPRVLRRAVVVS
jgi:hypothetical protein